MLDYDTEYGAINPVSLLGDALVENIVIPPGMKVG
jgi:hypothetical protein